MRDLPCDFCYIYTSYHILAVFLIPFTEILAQPLFVQLKCYKHSVKGGIVINGYKYIGASNKKINLYKKLIVYLALSVFTCLSSFLAIDKVMCERVPDEICQFLAEEGYDVEDIGFDQVADNGFFNVRIYHSSKPINYKNQSTNYWKVQRIAKITRLYYIITPYYEEIPFQ